MSLIEVEVFEEHCSTVEKETLRLLRLILNNQENIMSDLDTLNTAVGEVVADETTIATELGTIIADFKALQGQTNPDISGPLAALATLHTKLQGDAAAITAADPNTAPAQPTTGS